MDANFGVRKFQKADGKSGQKRSSDSSNQKPPASKRVKEDAEEKQKRLEGKEKHSKEKHRKPLQEAKVTSSDKLTGCIKAEAANGRRASDAEMDSPPSCENSFDINNNMSAELEETFAGGGAMGDRRGSALGDTPWDSEGLIDKTVKTKTLEIPEGRNKPRPKSSRNADSRREKGQESRGQRGDTKSTGKRSETSKKNAKDEAESEGEEDQNGNDDSPVKEEEEEEFPLQGDRLKEKLQAKAKTIIKESNTGRNKKDQKDGEGNPAKKRKKDQGEKVKSKKRERARKTKVECAGDEDKKDEDDKWKWWEEGCSHDGKKWKTLEHKGPLFPPEYEPLPENVSFYYNGEHVQLSPATEEVATFYAKMLEHEYTTKEVFQKNFFADWREEMTDEERGLIRSLSKCDFREIHQYFLDQAEKRKAMTKEEKREQKEAQKLLTEEYSFCTLDGHREKIGNFRVEPPGLFRGRGEHPKMGKLKKRIQPEDITINCSKDSKIPAPPAGHRWKKVQHDDTVTWLVSWVENVQGSIKYIMLNPSSKLKGEKDWQKYEIARKLKLKVDAIRSEYRRDWKSREMKKRQRGVAIYFIDKLALRAGNEKEEGETADTVGCCSLRVEHITLHEQLDGLEHVVEFDFLGKDSIRYYNKVPVEKRVLKNLKLFMENKNPDDDLFDRINTTYLNKTLQDSMKGLTAKVFRTYNASTTLQDQLNRLTSSDMSVEEKILAYNRANRAVAILCNHQRAAPKTFEKSMQNLQEKIELKEKLLETAKKELKEAKNQYRQNKTDKLKKLVEQKEKVVERLKEQLKKLRLQMTDREENKVIALGTSKLNYLDPRISVAWCKKFGVPIEKIYNKTQRDKFAWAIDMTDEDFQF
nr:DNA topoisomerase I, mitochondrial-like isoform X1 [Paramormyrops kingsleyae]XP_023679366.1 DNA topoisomerase I, mitochondrial-like isoform X1 [Paramormyrops kingsleyae]